MAAEATDRPALTLAPDQRTAARVAGLLYLVTTVTANFSEFYVGRLVSSDATQTAKNIADNQILFRLGAVSDLVTFAAVIVLLVALYTVLSPVNRTLALLAAFYRLAESAIFALITLNDFVALRLLGGGAYLKGFQAQQLDGLAQLFLDVHTDGYLIALIFFGLGSTVFAYLWFKSQYIPRWLAGLGVLGSLLIALVTLAIMVFPDLTKIVVPAYFAPIFVFEVVLGFWLTIRGVRVPAIAV